MIRIKSKIVFLVLILCSVLFSQNRMAIVLPSDLKLQSESFNEELINDITSFELFLLQNKINYSVLYSDELNDLLSQKFDVLIFPTSVILSEDEFRSLNSILENGIGIISFGNISYIENDEKIDIPKKLYGVELQQIINSDYQNILQHFTFETNYLKQQNNFELFIKASSLKYLYKVDNLDSFSFGCCNNQSDLTTSFYVFKSSGRFVHFGFSFSRIISDKNSLEEFQDLLKYLFSWVGKDSGIWLTKSEHHKKYFFWMLDLTKGLTFNEEVLMKFIKQNFPIVIASDNPERLKTFYSDYADKLSFALKVNCNINIDTLVKKINTSKAKIDYLILDKNCFDEREIKRLSFAGIETILIKNDKNYYYNQIYNLIIAPFSNLDLCLPDKIVVAEYPDKIECDKLNPDKTINEVLKIKPLLKPFDRTELINDFLINKLKVNAIEKSSEIVIHIDNPNEYEIRNFDLMIDSKKLSDKIIYDIRINGKSRFVQKDSLTNYIKIYFDSIAPKEDITINILFDNNI